jgi:hypothetical protein
MNSSYKFITLFILVSLSQLSFAQERNFGLGVIVGEPTGLSAKLWTSNTGALDFGLGWSIGGDRINRFRG